MTQRRFTPAEIAAFTRQITLSPGELDGFNETVTQQLRKGGSTIADSPLAGVSLMLLHTVGAKTGTPRVNPLVHLDFDGRWFVVGSNAGLDSDPAWTHNLRANPLVQVELGAKIFDVTARELASTERDHVWSILLEKNPTFAEYEKATTRVLPVFELVRSS